RAVRVTVSADQGVGVVGAEGAGEVGDEGGVQVACADGVAGLVDPVGVVATDEEDVSVVGAEVGGRARCEGAVQPCRFGSIAAVGGRFGVFLQLGGGFVRRVRAGQRVVRNKGLCLWGGGGLAGEFGADAVDGVGVLVVDGRRAGEGGVDVVGRGVAFLARPR
ncbi:hypothetical protein, partial [Streptomyces roseolus]|uniref:hypothetical protein n=1 Tax=Streptomyces roseolus TaxID=67358 RepID=UPI0037B614AC